MKNPRNASTRRGVALIVALLAVLVLSVLGVSLLFTTNTDQMVSKNYSAELEALFAAHAGLEVGIKHAFDDYMNDSKGLWQDSILALGNVSPPWRGPNAKLDSTGTITGKPNTYYYDLKDWQCSDPPPTNPCATPINDATWKQLADQPYNLPPDTELRWTDTGRGKTAMYLPNQGSFRLKFQEVPTKTSDPVSDFEKQEIRIVSVGQSGGAIGGVEQGQEGGIRSSRTVEATYKVKDIGIWNNAWYGTSSDQKLTGNCLIRGSIHYLNSQCPTCPPDRTPAVEFGGNSGQRNNYTGIDIEIGRRIPIPPNNALDAIFRLRVGSVQLASNQVWIGIDCSDSSKPCIPSPAGIGLTTGKGPNDAAYIGIPEYPAPRFIGSQSGNHREDKLDDYDAKDFDLTIPSYDSGTYTDKHGHSFPNAYVEYIRGTNDGKGVQALNLSMLNNAKNDFAFAENAVTSLATDVKVVAPSPVGNNSLYTANMASFPGLSAYDFEVGVPWNPAWGPNPGSSFWKTNNGIKSMDFLVDKNGSSKIVGVFKHLPTRVQDPVSTCVWEKQAGGHGFLFIPSGATLGGLTMQEVWNFIQRNFVRYDPTLNKNNYADLKRFLGIPQGNSTPWNAPLGIGPDFDSSGTVNGIEGNVFGRLLIWDVVYTDKTVWLGQDKPVKTNLCYMGRGTIAQVGGGNVMAYASVSNAGGGGADGYLLSIRTFPCVDVLGTMNGGTFYSAQGGANQSRVMLVPFSGSRFSINKQMELGGAFMSALLTFGQGAQLYVDQVPEVAECLNPFQIGDWHYYKVDRKSWTER